MSRELPILFSGAMVRAILAGQKTQTRRVIKPQPVLHDFNTGGVKYAFVPPQTKDGYLAVGCDVIGNGDTALLKRFPFGVAGDLLWVREKYWIVERENRGIGVPYLIFDGEWSGNVPDESAPLRSTRSSIRFGPHPSIHLPRWASRITLEVTGVRAERVQDIRHDDVLAEGIAAEWDHKNERYIYGSGTDKSTCPIEAFAWLWDSINGKTYPWESNPFVWVYEFKRIKP